MDTKTAQNIMSLTNESYEKIASSFSGTRSSIWREFLDFIPYVKQNDKVLDIGCGNGRLLQILKNKKIGYLGIDASDNLLNIAKKKHPGYNFKNGDILKMKKYPCDFDLVFCISVLNHIPSNELRKKALKNIYKRLKQGGILIMVNWNLWNLSIKKKGVLKYFVHRVLRKNSKILKDYHINAKNLSLKDVITNWESNEKSGILYYYAFTLKELSAMLDKTGFKVLKGYYSKGRYKGGNIVTIAIK